MLKIVIEWPSDQVTEWPSDRVTEWPSDQVTEWNEWPSDQMNGWQDDRKLRRLLTVRYILYAIDAIHYCLLQHILLFLTCAFHDMIKGWKCLPTNNPEYGWRHAAAVERRMSVGCRRLEVVRRRTTEQQWGVTSADQGSCYDWLCRNTAATLPWDFPCILNNHLPNIL